MKTYLLSILLTLSFQSIFAAEGVAKVLIAKGKVINLQDGKDLKKGDWVAEGATIQTEVRSFAKLIFIDKSNMSIGPNSQVVVEKFKKEEAGVITLLKGQLRSKVTKNYMDMTEKEKSKLFIKTRTAAMGVRGTDFQVNYNPENMNTSLITFEGAVAMGAINDLTEKILDQRNLEAIVSDPTAVMVTKGLFSGVMPGIDSKPVAPVKINTNQLKALESNDGSNFEKKPDSSVRSEKSIPKRNIIPPSVEGKDFQGDNKSVMIKEFSKLDMKTAQQMKSDFTVGDKDTSVNRQNMTRNTQFSDGGLINTEVVAYIAPPKNAAIDPMTKNPIMPLNFGSFDSSTGQYKNDFFKLNNEMKWIPTSTIINEGSSRFPASEKEQARMPAAPLSPLNNCINCATEFVGDVDKPQVDADAYTRESYDKINNVINDTKPVTKTRVKFQAQ